MIALYITIQKQIVLFKFIFRFGSYSTVSTDDAVLVIGGYDSDFSSVVAEYKDGSWTQIGNLGRATAHHRSMRSGPNILILGGMWDVVNKTP